MSNTNRCQVITIAFADGARAEEIGRRLATELGFRYVDDQIVERAAEMAGVTPAEVAEVEHARSLVTRILTALATSAVHDPTWVGAVALAEPDPSPAPTGSAPRTSSASTACARSCPRITTWCSTPTPSHPNPLARRSRARPACRLRNAHSVYHPAIALRMVRDRRQDAGERRDWLRDAESPGRRR